MAADFYAEIKVARDADEATIKAAIDKLIKKQHAKATTGDEAAIALVAHYNEIQDTLTDQAKRSAYDAGLTAPFQVGSRLLHMTTYPRGLQSGFGIGEVVGVRHVKDGDILTIRFGKNDKDIVAWHAGLELVTA